MVGVVPSISHAALGGAFVVPSGSHGARGTEGRLKLSKAEDGRNTSICGIREERVFREPHSPRIPICSPSTAKYWAPVTMEYQSSTAT